MQKDAKCKHSQHVKYEIHLVLRNNLCEKSKEHSMNRKNNVKSFAKCNVGSYMYAVKAM